MAMSANAVLMKFFKLPPAMRMMLALAGFGSLASILFMVLPALRTRQGKMWLLIIAGIGLLVFLLIWGIRRMFVGKKSAQLGEALESQGPTRGDVAEQEQIYREKFRGKLSDLKSNGLSIYKLPWFVLMGEPGCGKTASLIHSGLDFPLGKDEVPGFGGTRNYNWWFTNEAVILDTAGRIAFHEEGTTDKVEWEYFCKLLKQNRPRCPINGIVLAIPADKLLRDSSEERAQKATVLRERLRQIHQLLGVRFPTFLLVTKMDLVGGFSEFFEEIRVDLAQRNQMCGWSRPGEFQEPYDPATFGDAFDEVHQRLREWGMRYLQRKATEDELGMIVTYPESFRQLRTALEDYVGTIFQKSPLLEPPFFRGFYFTSAVQEGAPILDVFSHAAAGRPVAERAAKAIDSKAFFIHDLYEKKVFPEHGLVFRSAKHVSLNRRMRKMVWIGSAAMLILMFTFFGLGWSGVNGLVTNPRKDCTLAGEAIEKRNASYQDLAGNLRLAKALHTHYLAYEGGWNWVYAKLLFIGADISRPQDDVGRIHAGFVLQCVFKPILEEVGTRLAAMKLEWSTPREVRERYLAAVAVYTKWYGEVVGQHDLPALDGPEAVQRRAELDKLLEFLGLATADAQEVSDQFQFALDLLAGEERAFAREILREKVNFASGDGVARDAKTIADAVNAITKSWMPLTRISADSTNLDVKYWAEFAARVGELRGRYGQIVGLADRFGEASDFEEAAQAFLEQTEGIENLGDLKYNPEPGTLNEAFFNFAKFLLENEVPQTADYRIRRLGELLALFESQWNDEFDPIQEALKLGAPDETTPPQDAVYTAIRSGKDDLKSAFSKSLRGIRKELGLAPNQEPLDYYVKQNLVTASEAHPPEAFDGPAKLVLSSSVFGTGNRLKSYLGELRTIVSGSLEQLQELEDLNKWSGLLSQMSATEPPGEYLKVWLQDVQDQTRGPRPEASVIRQKSLLADRPFWQSEQLYSLAVNMWRGRQASTVGVMLTRMAEKATETTRAEELPGLARLMPGFDDESRDLPFEQNRFNTVRPQRTVEQPVEQPADAPSTDRRRRSRPRASEPETTEERRTGRSDERTLLRAYHTRQFLATTLRLTEKIKVELDKHPGGQAVSAALDRAASTYAKQYFLDWFGIYSDPRALLGEATLGLLEKCRDGALSWPEYVAIVTNPDSTIADDLAERTRALISEVVFFHEPLPEGEPDADAAYGRIEAVLSELKHDRRSLPDLHDSMTRVNLPRGAGAPENVFSDQISGAWRSYVSQVEALGPLADPHRRNTASPPDVDALRKTIIYQRATTVSFPTIAPLVQVAEYGQQLLIHELDRKLADVFVPHRGHYPIVHGTDALDDSTAMSRVKQVLDKALAPEQFFELLKQAEEFRTRYGALYEDVATNSPAHHVLLQCQRWVAFLYDDGDALRRGETPRPLDVYLAVVKPPVGSQFQNAGSVYSELQITLPLLLNGNPAPPIKRDVRAARGDFDKSVQKALSTRTSADYQWDLTSAARTTYANTTAFVTNLNERSQGKYPPTASAFELDGHPWALLLLMGARADNDLRNGLWQFPIVIPTPRNPIGFFIGLRIGKKPFPRPIPPLEQLPPRPKMAKASAFLNPR